MLVDFSEEVLREIFLLLIVSAQKDQALSIESEVNVGTPVIDECQPEKICPTQPNL